MSILLYKVIKTMLKFQELSNIKGECITNTMTLYDLINTNYKTFGIKAKAKAVLLISTDKDEDETIINLCYGHLVIELDDGSIIDPSHETNSKKNKEYYDNIKDLLSGESKKFYNNFDMKYIISEFIEFKKKADIINSGEFKTGPNTDFYNDQWDLIELILN